jgi:hypothetical protein
LSVPAPSTIEVAGAGTDQRQAYSGDPGSQLTYQWSLLSSTCSIGTFLEPLAQTATLTTNALGSFQVRRTNILFGWL